MIVQSGMISAKLYFSGMQCPVEVLQWAQEHCQWIVRGVVNTTVSDCLTGLAQEANRRCCEQFPNIQHLNRMIDFVAIPHKFVEPDSITTVSPVEQVSDRKRNAVVSESQA